MRTRFASALAVNFRPNDHPATAPRLAPPRRCRGIARLEAFDDRHGADLAGGNTYRLVLEDGVWSATYVPRTVVVALGTSEETLFVTLNRRSAEAFCLTHAPDVPMSRLEDALRLSLETFVHPGTGRIGHAFRFESGGIDGAIEIFL
ncbi:MAG: hypothetical protein OXN97_14480 [Bryobacterales bacterium]|nr:hypothetical protein [Bryobacterales bacterium]